MFLSSNKKKGPFEVQVRTPEDLKRVQEGAELEDYMRLARAYADPSLNPYVHGLIPPDHLGGLSHTHAIPAAPLHVHHPEVLLSMLNSRMGWRSSTGRFSYVHCTKLNEEMAVVFGIVNEKPFMIETPLDLFPNDTLITQLRILEG